MSRHILGQSKGTQAMEALAMAQQLMGQPTQPNGSAPPADDETPF
jgi:hypothetical protein